MTSAHSALSLVFSRALGKVVVHLYGALDAASAHQLKDRLTDVIDGQGNRRVVLELSGLERIDRVGFSVLIDALKRIQRLGGDLVLSGPTPAVTDAFEAAGLDRILAITPAWTHPSHGDDRTTHRRPAGWNPAAS